MEINKINSLLKDDFIDLKEEIKDDDLEVGPEDDGKSGSEAFMQQIKKELEDCGYTDIEFKTNLYPRRKWAEWYDGEGILFTVKRGNVTIKACVGGDGLSIGVITSTTNPNATKNIYYVSELEDEGIIDDESFREFIKDQQNIYHNDDLFDDSYIYLYFSYYNENGDWLYDSYEFGWDDCNSLTDIINSLTSTESIDEDIANMIKDGKLDNSEVPESEITESIDGDMLDSSYESKEVEIIDEDELDSMSYNLKSRIKLIRDKNIEGYEIDDTDEEIDNLKFYVSKNANGKEVKDYLHYTMFDYNWPYILYDSKDRVWLGFTEDYLRIEAPTVYERLIGKIEEEIEDDMIETSPYSDSAEEYVNKKGCILPMNVKKYVQDKHIAWEGNSLDSDWIIVYDRKCFHNNENSDYYLDSMYAENFQDLDDPEDTNYIFIERLPSGKIEEICYMDNRYTRDILRDNYGKTNISNVTFNNKDFIKEEIDDDMLEVPSKEEIETLKNKKVKLDRSKYWVKKYLNNLCGIDYLDRDEDFSALDFYIKRNYDGRNVTTMYKSRFWDNYPFMLVDNKGRVWDGMEEDWINARIEDSSVREEILNLPDVSNMLDDDTVNEDIDSTMIDSTSLDDLYNDIYKLDTKNLFRGEGNENHLIYYIRANRMPTKKEVTERLYPFQGLIDPEDFVNEITHIRYSELPPEYREAIEENPKCIFEGHNPYLASHHNDYFSRNSSSDSDNLVIKTIKGFEPVSIRKVGQTKMSLYIHNRIVSWVNVSDTGYIYYLETKPEYRGMGLGSILIEKAINEMGGYWLHIEKPNIRVQSWYESLGFVMLDDNEDTYVKLMVLKNRIEDYNKLKERCNGDIKLMLGNLSRRVYKDLVDYETKPEVRTVYDEKGNIIKEEISDDDLETVEIDIDLDRIETKEEKEYVAKVLEKFRAYPKEFKDSIDDDTIYWRIAHTKRYRRAEIEVKNFKTGMNRGWTIPYSAYKYIVSELKQHNGTINIKEEIDDDMIDSTTKEYGHHRVEDITNFTDKEAMNIISGILLDTSTSPTNEKSRRQQLEYYAQEPYHWGIFDKWEQSDKLTLLFSYDKKPNPDTGDWAGGFHLTEEEYELMLNAISPKMNEEINDDMIDSTESEVVLELTPEQMFEYQSDYLDYIYNARSRSNPEYRVYDTEEEIKNLKFYISKNNDGTDVKDYFNEETFNVPWDYIIFDSKDRVWFACSELYLSHNYPKIYKKLNPTQDDSTMNEEIEDDMLDTVKIDLNDIRTKEEKQFIFDLLKVDDFIIDGGGVKKLLKATINDNSVWKIAINNPHLPPEKQFGYINLVYHFVGRTAIITLDTYNRIVKAVEHNSTNVNEAKEDKERFSKWANDAELEQSFYDNAQRLDDKDIYSWMRKTPDDLRQAIKDLGTTNKEDREEAMKGAKLVDENDYWKVYKINTYEASKLLGKGTKWCISGDKVGKFVVNTNAQSEEEAKDYVNIAYDPDEIVYVKKIEDDSWDDIYEVEVKMPNGKYYFNHYEDQEDATYFFLISKPENKECYGDEKLNKIAIKADGWGDVEIFDSQDNAIKETTIPHYDIDKLYNIW